MAELQIDRLAPVVVLLYQCESAAADRDEWGAILEGGSFALGTWCKKWKIADPHDIARGSLRHLRTVEEDDEKAQELSPEPFDGDLDQAMDLKLQIYSHMSRRLMYENLTASAQRLLLWMLGSLWISMPPDIVRISKRFLPTDISVSPEQASAAYKELYERGLIERVDAAQTQERPDRLALRLVVQGVNDSRHAALYEEETFGYPGARIEGKQTCGTEAFIEMPEALSAMLSRWFKEEQELAQLRDSLQAKMGDDKVYVEKAEIKVRKEIPQLLVSFRYPLDDDVKDLITQMSTLAQEWLKERLVRQS
jgi:hypothetical protein